MSQPDLTGYDAIAIVGRPTVGKTTLAKLMSQTTHRHHRLIHTDDFIDGIDFKEAPFMILDAIEAEDSPYIVEGVQVARLLKHGKATGWKPDLVILVDARKGIQKSHQGFATMVRKNVNDWRHRNRDIQFYRVITH